MIDRVVRELNEAECVLWLSVEGTQFRAEAWEPDSGCTVREGVADNVADAIGALSRELRKRPLDDSQKVEGS